MIQHRKLELWLEIYYFTENTGTVEGARNTYQIFHSDPISICWLTPKHFLSFPQEASGGC
jgi:hypothetical protein